MYSAIGRVSIPPEVLLKASLSRALYTVRSERLFCELLGYNLLFRWFLDVPMEGEPFDASSFSKNRERLIEHDVAQQFFKTVVEHASAAALMSSDHFSVDGTLIEAWACSQMGQGAPGFSVQALSFHHSADRISVAAREGDGVGVLRELGATLQTCTGCHAGWKQQVVNGASWQ